MAMKNLMTNAGIGQQLDYMFNFYGRFLPYHIAVFALAVEQFFMSRQRYFLTEFKAGKIFFKIGGNGGQKLFKPTVCVAEIDTTPLNDVLHGV